MSDQLELLHTLSVLRGLQDREIDVVFAMMEDMVLPSRQVLFEEGSRPNVLQAPKVERGFPARLLGW